MVTYLDGGILKLKGVLVTRYVPACSNPSFKVIQVANRMTLEVI